MDFDPRDYDSRDEERFNTREDTSKGTDSLDRNDVWLVDVRSRDRDDDDARELGRGPGDSRESNSGEHGRDPREDARWPERDREPRDRTLDPREPFVRDLALPRGLERELVRDRDREYTLRGSESRTLATVGAFRVVSSRDLRDRDNRPADPRSGDLRHLREQGLIVGATRDLESQRQLRHRLESELDQSEFAAAWTEGRTLRLTDAVSFTLTELELLIAEHAVGAT